MGSVGAPEVLVILIVALIVLGPERLPEAARQLGRFVGEVRRIGAGFQAEVRDAMESAMPASSPQPAPGAPPGPSDGVEPAPAPQLPQPQPQPLPEPLEEPPG